MSSLLLEENDSSSSLPDHLPNLQNPIQNYEITIFPFLYMCYFWTLWFYKEPLIIAAELSLYSDETGSGVLVMDGYQIFPLFF